MPMQQSTMIPLGSPMPAFTLPDVVSGHTVASDTLDVNKPVLVLFICAHCPFSRHLAPAIKALAHDYRDRVTLLALSANDPKIVPEDSPEGLKGLARTLDWPAPFLFDESQDVARAFGAACSPECYIYDAQRLLVYRGQIDDSRPGTGRRPTAAPVREALDAVLRGLPVNPNQKPGLGCNIKWTPRTAAAPIASR